MSETVVLVTGFGPFGVHDVNASWEAVKLLPKYEIDNTKIVIEEIPVIYDVVDKTIPMLWEKYKPTLVVHVGVSSHAKELTLETIAKKGVYVKQDTSGNVSCAACPNIESTDCLETLLDLEDIRKYLNENCNIKACLSQNAGLYLCEYTYYTSLQVDRQRVLFVHVPVLDNPFSAEEIADGIFQIIRRALEQLTNVI